MRIRESFIEKLITDSEIPAREQRTA